MDFLTKAKDIFLSTFRAKETVESKPIVPISTASLIKQGEFNRVIEHIQPNLEHGPWIAGGAARSLWLKDFDSINDIDVFFANQEQYDNLRHKWTNHERSYPEPVGTFWSDWFTKITTANATTFQNSKDSTFDIQFIKRRFYTSAQDVISDFDFTCCQVVTDGKDFVFADYAREDIMASRLRVHQFHPESYLPRYLRYLVYGYSMPAEEALKWLEDERNTFEYSGTADDLY